MLRSRLLRWLPAVLLFLLGASPAAHAQGRLNLGLEADANHRQPLALWLTALPAGGRLAFDSVTFRQGRSSLRLELPTREDGPGRASLSTNVVPLDSVRGRLVTVSAWVRTRGWQGRAGLAATATSLTGAGLSPGYASVLDSLPANLDWRRIEVRLPVKATAFSFGLSVQAQGSGRLWVDNIELRVGGRVLPEGPVPATEALLLPPAAALAANWDFERPLPRAAGPEAAGGATAALDSARPQHGRRYLRVVRRNPAGQPTPTIYLGTLRLTRQEGGKTLRVLGYWRQPEARPDAPDGARPAFVSRLLATRLPAGGAWRPDTLGPAPPLPAPGPQWTAFSFEVPMQLKLFNASPDEWTALTLSLALPAPGVVEIDNLTFMLNGKPYAPTSPPVAPPPSAAEIAWLRTASRPLRLATPATEATDLAALAASLGPARLVGLGEVTHGSHEIFALHDKLTRYLIGQKGFTGLALEASPGACAALTAYLRTGQGDPARLLAALDGWHTTELRELLGWLRSYQQAHPATPLTLAGLDIRQPEEAVASLRQLLEPGDDFAQSRLRQVAHLLALHPHPAPDDPDLRHPDQPQDSLLAPLHRLLAELATGLDARAKLRARPTSLAKLAHQRYYLRLVEQGATWRRLAGGLAFNYYQACLAENAAYLSQTAGPGGAATKLIIWASNSAVAKALTLEERLMGEWLRATLGPGYTALGLVLGQGSFAALGSAGQWASAPLAAAPTGSYEAWLRTTPGPASWLAPGRAELTDDNTWLFQQQLLREVGYRAARNEFMLHSLRREFDAVVFWRDSTPAHFLPAGR
ncbi:MAG: erythromycin esterase family protein [Janthinobacterium lividum]